MLFKFTCLFLGFTLFFANNVFAQKKTTATDNAYYLLDSLKSFHQEQGAYEKALAYAEIRIKKAEKEFGKEHNTYIEYANSLALLHQEYGNYEKAEPYFWIIKDFFQKKFGEKNAQYISTLSSLATLQDYIGNYQKAEALHLQVLNLEAQVSGKQSINYLIYLNSLAFSYYNNDKQLRAIPLFKKVVDLCTLLLGEQHTYYPTALINLASAYKLHHEYIVAEELFLKALDIESKILAPDDPSYAISLNNLASLYHDMGNYEKAEKLYLQAIDILDQNALQQDPYYLNYNYNLGELYIDLRQFANAKTYLNKAFTINVQEEIQHSVDFVAKPEEVLNYEFKYVRKVLPALNLCYELSNVQYELSGNKTYLKQAYKSLKAGMKISNQMRSSFIDNQDKLDNLSQLSNIVENAISTSVLLQKVGEKPSIKEAFYFAEQSKSILLLEALKGNRARTLGDLPDSLALLELELQQKKNTLKRQHHEASTPAEYNVVIKAENELNEHINTFITSIKHQYPKYHALKYEHITATSEEIQALLDPQTLLLEYFVADSMLYLFALSNQTLDLYPIAVSKDSLNQQINRLRQALSDYQLITNSPEQNYKQYTSTAYWFYKHTIEVALKDKEVENLIIITDGDLGHLPFSVFLTDETTISDEDYRNLPYLLHQYNISYNYSSTLWKEIRTQKAPKNNHKALAFAPVYKMDQDTTTLVARSDYAATIRSSLIPLPAAQEELKALSELLEGTFLKANQATETTFKQIASDYSIIHLSMHGVLNKRLSMLSALVFSETPDSLDDGLLQAYEIAHLNVNADLVVLSACETGYGTYKKGEGIMSIARSFMYAGASSLIVSLWQVNDDATAIIIGDFYDYLTQGYPKDEALRLAKIDFLQSSSNATAHPAFWSPFIQLGDNGAIPSITKFNYKKWTKWLGLSTLLILLISFLFFKKRK